MHNSRLYDHWKIFRIPDRCYRTDFIEDSSADSEYLENFENKKNVLKLISLFANAYSVELGYNQGKWIRVRVQVGKYYKYS